MTQKLEYDSELHAQLLEIGHEIEKGTTHKLPDVIVDGILATFDVMGASEIHIQQMIFDLKQAKYKIFDWLGMMYTGRYQTNQFEDKIVFKIVERMVQHYVAMKHVGGWAWSYRGHIDLEMELENPVINGTHCSGCIESYDGWYEEDYKGGN